MSWQGGLGVQPLQTGDDEGRRIVRRLTAGDEEALGMMMESFGGALLQYAHRLVGDRHAAEEICQDALLKAWQQGEEFDQDGHLKAWLFRVARHRAIDCLRRRRCVVVEPFGNQAAEMVVHPEAEAERAWLTEAILDAMSELPPPYKSVIQMRFFHDMGYREIAECLKIPIGTVKSRLNYGLKGLARILRARQVLQDVLEH